MGKGSDQPQQSSTYTPPPQVQEILNLAMPGIRKFAASVPQRYGGSTIAGFDPSQEEGQQAALGAAGSQDALAKQGLDATRFLTSTIWDPKTNPALQGAIDAAVRPITTNYQQVVKPGIRDEFQGAGQQFGGSRRFNTEDLGAGQYLTAVGDTASKLTQDQYANNLNAYVRALGLLPQTQDAQLAGARTRSAVGDVRQNLAQQRLNEQVGNFNYDQLAPFLQSQELINLISGIPGGTTTTTGNMPQRNPWSGALGGAAAGASLGSALLPGIGTGAGAGLGALLSFL